MHLNEDDKRSIRLEAKLLTTTAPKIALGLKQIAARFDDAPNGSTAAKGAKPVAPMIDSPISQFIASLPKSAIRGERTVAKVIWQFWHSGLEGAPDVVRRCNQTWKQFNPDHEVRLLSLDAANAVLDLDLEQIFAQMSVDLGWAGKSDLIRVMLLAKFGGIWADATTFCLAPLSEWMHPGLEQNGFFCFRNPTQDNDHELVLWFMASSAGHPMLSSLLILCEKYLFKPRVKKLRIIGKVRLWKKFDIKPGDRPGVELLVQCGKDSKIAGYFWIFYLFKTILDRHPKERNALRLLNNDHVQEHGNLRNFLTANVSKQTYKGVPSETLERRSSILFDGDRVKLDFRLKSADIQVQWWEVRKTLAISEERKVIFIHIPKCGGTSVDKSALFEGGIARWGHGNLNYYRRILGGRFNEFRVLTMVRNPWDRLASAFHFASVKAVGYKDANARVAKELLERYDNDFSRFLPEFCESPQRFLRALWFRPSIEFFDPAQCNVPWFIQKLENIDDLGPLNDFVGMKTLELGHHRKGPMESRGPGMFTPDVFLRVGEIYARDVAAFDYEDTARESLQY